MSAGTWGRFVPTEQPGVWELRGADRGGPAGWFAKATPEQLALYLDPARCRFLPCPDPRIGHHYRLIDGRAVWVDEAAPVSDTVWGYASTDDPEIWTGSCASREEVIAKARSEGINEPFWIVQGHRPTANDLTPDADWVVDDMFNRAGELGGEAAEGFDVSDEAKKELEQLLVAWADRYVRTTWWIADGKPERVESVACRRWHDVSRRKFYLGVEYLQVSGWRLAGGCPCRCGAPATRATADSPWPVCATCPPKAHGGNPHVIVQPTAGAAHRPRNTFREDR